MKKIRERDLTKKQYYNMALIIRHSLEYAVDHDLIEKNPYNEFKIDGKLFRKVKKPDDATQVFLTTERPLVEALISMKMDIRPRLQFHLHFRSAFGSVN